MAESVTVRADLTRLTNASPVIVELVGPAGAGKTTLSRLLSQVAENVQIGPDIELRKFDHIPVFIKHIPAWMPIYLHGGGASNRQFTWEELKYITYLKGWPGMLRRQNQSQGRVVLLDHGPIFRLATLLEFGPEKLKSAAFTDWWSRLYRQWAFTIDIIVWLDTSDDILLERINSREQQHAVKGNSSREALLFLMRYRMAYMRTLRRLMDYRQPRLLQFDTSQEPVERIAGEILAACRD
jgi:shikimate kinase